MFLDSPYFNRQDRLKNLGAFFIQKNPGQTPDKQALYTLLYGAKSAYREQAVYDALSQLNKLLSRFLALREFENDPTAQDRHLLKALANQQEEAAYLRQWKKAHLAWEQYPYQDLAYYKGQYALYRHASVFEAGLQRRGQDTRLEKTVNYLDLHYWGERLKYSCELLNRSHILKQSAPQDLIVPLQQWIKILPDTYRNKAAIQAYLLIFNALQSPGDETFYLKWIQWLDINSHLFSPEEAADMYNYAQNYCVRQINQGNSAYLARLFTLFEQLATKDLILDQGYMDHRKLKNMVAVGIRLKAYEWVDDFLHSYKGKLLPEFQVDAYRFNLASLRHAQGQHSEALSLLQQIEFRDVFDHLSARSLMLKLYYESDEDAALEFLLETFRLYLQRNRSINPFQRRIHLNLLRLSRKLYRLRAQRSILAPGLFQERLAGLTQQIKTAEEVANRSWLLTQVAVLAEE